MNGMFRGEVLTSNERLNRNFTFPDLNYALPGAELINSFYKSSSNKSGYPDWWPDISVYHGLLHNGLQGKLAIY